MNVRVYVLLPVHNRRDVTLSFVKCLQAQDYRNFRLLLIDDGSQDGTAEAVQERIHDVVIMRGRGRWWWAGSLQQGFKWLKRNHVSRNDVVLIMNDDTVFDQDFISVGLRILKHNPNAMLTATGINIRTGLPQDAGGYKMDWRYLAFSETYDNSRINCLSTRGLMTRVGDFLDVNGFYPKLIPHYLSDLEFTMRAQKRGKQLLLHPEFQIKIDFETTGIKEIDGSNWLLALANVFSKRAAMNPISWSNFILLHSPWEYKYINIRRIWIGFLMRGIYRFIIVDFKIHYPNMTRYLKRVSRKLRSMSL